MDGVAYFGSGTNEEIENQRSVLPAYAPYLCLVFRLVAAVVYLLFSSWVVFTIKSTRSLHKPHNNIYLANIMISKMIFTLSGTIIAGIMMISYQLGVESPISCYLLSDKILPYYVTIISFMIIATDKAIAVISPFKYRRLMTSCTIATIIIGVWLFSIIPTAYIVIYGADGRTEIPEYRTCLSDGNRITQRTIVITMPFS